MSDPPDYRTLLLQLVSADSSLTQFRDADEWCALCSEDKINDVIRHTPDCPVARARQALGLDVEVKALP